jgi:hypothetical protein
MVSRGFFDQIRTLDFSGISGTYAVVGSALTKPARMICFTNKTEGDMYFTDDTTKDKIFVAAGSYKLWDFQSNMNAQKDDSFVISKQTQFYVKQIEAPVSGSVYIEIIY